MNKRRRVILICMLLGWIGFIFCRSLQPATRSGEESRWMLDLLTRLLPIRPTMRQVRKAAHFIEFAALGGLASLAFGERFRGWKSFPFALFTGMTVALCDETIQLYVEGRSGGLFVRRTQS